MDIHEKLLSIAPPEKVLELSLSLLVFLRHADAKYGPVFLEPLEFGREIATQTQSDATAASASTVALQHKEFEFFMHAVCGGA